MLLPLLFVALSTMAQGLPRVYDESIDPLQQIETAVSRAKEEGKFVVCQVGGNWCPWCLRFADFVRRDTTISQVIDEHFVYIHVNYNPRSTSLGEDTQAAALMKRLGQCGRFGFPVFVILNADGEVIHIQDSSFLEEGQSYNAEKVLRFFKNWTPEAVRGS